MKHNKTSRAGAEKSEKPYWLHLTSLISGECSEEYPQECVISSVLAHPTRPYFSTAPLHIPLTVHITAYCGIWRHITVCYGILWYITIFDFAAALDDIDYISTDLHSTFQLHSSPLHNTSLHSSLLLCSPLLSMFTSFLTSHINPDQKLNRYY